MENASKALIIAGAILLAIAIIGIGMYVYNNAQEAVSGTDMSQEQVATYNEQFTRYVGNIRGSRAKTLCTTINNHNLAATDASELIVLTFGEDLNDNQEFDSPTDDAASGTTPADITTVSKQILSGRTYTVTCAYDPNTGLVSKMSILLVE